MIRRTFILIFLLLTFLCTSNILINAQTKESFSMIEGASIRTEGVQWKFSASFTDEELDKRGFFVIYGKTSVEDLMVLLEEEGPYIVNGKEAKIALSSKWRCRYIHWFN